MEDDQRVLVHHGNAHHGPLRMAKGTLALQRVWESVGQDSVPKGGRKGAVSVGVSGRCKYIPQVYSLPGATDTRMF